MSQVQQDEPGTMEWHEWRSQLGRLVAAETGCLLTEVIGSDGMTLAKRFWKQGQSPEDFFKEFEQDDRTEEVAALDEGFDPRWEL